MTVHVTDGGGGRADAGDEHHRARQMDPMTGRFTGMDPWWGGASRPPSLHRYTYADVSPASLVDPTGHMSVGESLTVEAVIVVVSTISMGCATIQQARARQEAEVGEAYDYAAAILQQRNKCSCWFSGTDVNASPPVQPNPGIVEALRAMQRVTMIAPLEQAECWCLVSRGRPGRRDSK
jgi:RHS repeat-associated protein